MSGVEETLALTAAPGSFVAGETLAVTAASLSRWFA
jgi:hypothetical protein